VLTCGQEKDNPGEEWAKVIINSQKIKPSWLKTNEIMHMFNKEQIRLLN
jgi:hypothetical protein